MTELKRSNTTRIYKYDLPVVDKAVVSMPKGAEVLTVQVQNDWPDSQVRLWAKINLEAPIESRMFFVVGTGHPMPVEAGRFIGTFQLNEGRLVFHVFEEAVNAPG